jgi:SLA1 homology domain 1, SHD1
MPAPSMTGPQPTPAAPVQRPTFEEPVNPLPVPQPNQIPAPPEPAIPAPADEMPEEPAPESPATPAKPGNDVEDLFKDTDEKAPATEPAPAEQPAEKKEEKKDDVEDLFKSSQAQPNRANLPEGIEDLFADPPADVARSAKAEQPDAMRVWTDNSGKYRVTARLVAIGPNHVRLLKDTGKFTTVPFARLSHADLALVRSLSTGSIASNN